MSIVLLPVLAGAIAGWWRGGRLGALERLRFRASGLILAALVVQVALHRFPSAWRVPLLFCSYAAVGLWIARNVRGRRWSLRAGLSLVALGWALNVAAIVPNGGMPVSESAMQALDVAPGYDVSDGHLSKHVATHGGAVDMFFGDSIPVPALGAVISVGDIALAAGIALTLAAGMTAEGSRQAPAVAPASARQSCRRARTSSCFRRRVASGIPSTICR